MKAYFDNLEPHDSNMNHFSSSPENNFWIVSSGTNIKKKLLEYNIEIDNINNISDPGFYFINVNADPIWWSGVLQDPGTPRDHVISLIPDNIVDLVKQKKLRIIIAGDREGGGMITPKYDCFASTTLAIREKKLPTF